MSENGSNEEFKILSPMSPRSKIEDWINTQLFVLENYNHRQRFRKLQIFPFRSYCVFPSAEEKERLTDILSEDEGAIPKLHIILKARTIRICKPLLLNSRLLRDQILEKELKVFEKMDLDVSEVVVHSLLLGFKVSKLEKKMQVTDYFILFWLLDLKIGISEILNYVQRNVLDYSNNDLLSLFRSVLRMESTSTQNSFPLFPDEEEEEEEENSSLKEKDPPPMETVHFATSFCALLFCLLKNRVIEEKDDHPSRNFFLSKTLMEGDLSGHSDFKNFNFEENYYDNFFRQIFEESEKPVNEARIPTDIILRTENSKEVIRAHVLFLLLRSTFFQKMLFFGGVESQHWKEKGEVNIMMLKHRSVRIFKEFCYTKKINVDSGKNSSPYSVVRFNVLLECLQHSDQFLESSFQEELIRLIPFVLNIHEKRNEDLFSKRIEHVSNFLIHDSVKPLIIEKIFQVIQSKIDRLHQIENKFFPLVESLFSASDDPSVADRLSKPSGFTTPVNQQLPRLREKYKHLRGRLWNQNWFKKFNNSGGERQNPLLQALRNRHSKWMGRTTERSSRRRRPLGRFGGGLFFDQDEKNGRRRIMAENEELKKLVVGYRERMNDLEVILKKERMFHSKLKKKYEQSIKAGLILAKKLKKLKKEKTKMSET